MAGRCVLVFGVSGVGKTSACEAYVATHPDTLFISASGLLKAARNSSAETLRTAATGAIVDNQALLGPALAAFRAGREERDVLVDAHGVIDNDHELVRVPSSAIAALKPHRLILLEASPETVAARRANSERRRPLRDLAAINLEIAAERETVTAYAKALSIGLVIADAGPRFTLDALLDATCPARSG
ncbi:ATP-binding protein [Rhizorhabdus argentea]|uniref:ATP-binding protein n=1 Tax=Rhizorhabdus argentea TaxID=1387174 RepID=UPI0030EB35BA